MLICFIPNIRTLIQVILKHINNSILIFFMNSLQLSLITVKILLYDNSTFIVQNAWYPLITFVQDGCHLLLLNLFLVAVGVWALPGHWFSFFSIGSSFFKLWEQNFKDASMEDSLTLPDGFYFLFVGFIGLQIVCLPLDKLFIADDWIVVVFWNFKISQKF